MESLVDKLKSFGLPIKKPESIPLNDVQKKKGIEEFISGKEVLTPYGTTFLTEQLYSGEYLHGTYPLNASVDVHSLGDWGNIDCLLQGDISKVLFLDTETTGLMGGTGTFVFLTGIGYFSENGFQMTQIFLRNPSEEQAYLACVSEWVRQFSTIISYNGKAFDIPLLNTRFILNRSISPFSGLSHLDLLTLTRKLWRNLYPSRSLSYLEGEILHAQRSQTEVPGWMIPAIYQDYLSQGNAAEVSRVFYHNAFDILSLAGLFKHCARLLSAPDDHYLNGYDFFALARMNKEMGRHQEAKTLFEKYLQVSQPGLKEDHCYYYADYCKSQGDWKRAVELWEKLSQSDYLPAYIELAKYYEHRAKNEIEALKWTISALDVLKKNQPSLTGQVELLSHRKDRLMRRINHV